MPENADDSDAQRAYRRGKVERAREQGVDPIAYRFDVDTAIADIRTEFPSLPPDSTTDRAVAIAGRLALLRKHGGLTFAVLQDRTATIQLFVDRQHLGVDLFAGFDDLDRGDWLGVKGITEMPSRQDATTSAYSATLFPACSKVVTGWIAHQLIFATWRPLTWPR